jgi:hypothetical protein
MKKEIPNPEKARNGVKVTKLPPGDAKGANYGQRSAIRSSALYPIEENVRDACKTVLRKHKFLLSDENGDRYWRRTTKLFMFKVVLYLSAKPKRPVWALAYEWVGQSMGLWDDAEMRGILSDLECSGRTADELGELLSAITQKLKSSSRRRQN